MFWDQSGIDEAERRMKVPNGRRVASAIKLLKVLQLECARVLPEALLIPVMYGSEKMIRKERRDLGLRLYR